MSLCPFCGELREKEDDAYVFCERHEQERKKIGMAMREVVKAVGMPKSLEKFCKETSFKL